MAVAPMTEAELRRRASDAQRILDEPVLRDTFAAMERDALEELLAIKAAWPWADRKRRMLADRINVIRDLKHRLAMSIQMGLYESEMAKRRG